MDKYDPPTSNERILQVIQGAEVPQLYTATVSWVGAGSTYLMPACEQGNKRVILFAAFHTASVINVQWGVERNGIQYYIFPRLATSNNYFGEMPRAFVMSANDRLCIYTSTGINPAVVTVYIAYVDIPISTFTNAPQKATRRG